VGLGLALALALGLVPELGPGPVPELGPGPELAPGHNHLKSSHLPIQPPVESEKAFSLLFPPFFSSKVSCRAS